MNAKKMVSGVLACSMFFSLFGVSYASPVAIEKFQSVNHEQKLRISKEDFTTYVTYHEIPQTLDIEVVDKHTGEKVFEQNGASKDTVSSWLEKPTEGNRQKRAFFLIPLVWGASEIAAAITAGLMATTATVATVAAAEQISKTVKKYQDDSDNVYYSTKQEIEDAADAIPKKLKKEDDNYSVDIGKFSKKVKNSSRKKDPKTGWEIEPNRGNNPHKGDVWKLYNGDKRIASLTAEGKIVGK